MPSPPRVRCAYPGYQPGSRRHRSPGKGKARTGGLHGGRSTVAIEKRRVRTAVNQPRPWRKGGVASPRGALRLPRPHLQAACEGCGGRYTHKTIAPGACQSRATAVFCMERCGVAGLVPLSPQRGEGDGRCRQGARSLPGQGRLVLLPLQRRGASAGREPDYTGPHFSACQRIHRMCWQRWFQQHTP